ncbi:hypothetical protein H0X90_21825 [Burkholderia sp. 9775_39]|uniref:hypothetical protein n=1 Tax=unclassified Burkholderia TaxID=2613784 RepID=UPI0018C3F302|nr:MULTISPECIES: hypothetical protein [unclassified Burkholderia]MBG0879433.1 hypothetical protein [Burkholderia sp. 9775_39]MBG0884574.1 hypothetical protein [Burkholderia sp. 9773_38]
MRQIIFSGLLAAISTIAAAQAPELTVTGRPGADRDTYACNNADIAVQLSSLLDTPKHNAREEIDLQQRGACVGYPHGSRISIVSETTSSDSTPVVLVADSNHQYPDLYVTKREIVPLTPDELADMRKHACGRSTGGEIDRWELSSDGTPKLKRYFVTSKCVNGKLVSTTKRLN